ncbi:MAG: SdpI family protein [Thermodesulfobacteriota bacterium]
MYSASDKTCITMIGIGILVVLVSVPLILRKIKMNGVYGFRIGKAFESDENWYTINEFGGKALALWGVAIIVAGIVASLLEPASVLTFFNVCMLSVAIPIVATALYAKRM